MIVNKELLKIVKDEADAARRKDAERYRRLRHKLTCGHFSKEEELAVLGARDAASFDAVIDAMNGANTY